AEALFQSRVLQGRQEEAYAVDGQRVLARSCGHRHGLARGRPGMSPSAMITGNCMTSKVDFGATLVGKVTAIGITLAEEEVPLFSKLGQDVKRGDACQN